MYCYSQRSGIQPYLELRRLIFIARVRDSQRPGCLIKVHKSQFSLDNYSSYIDAPSTKLPSYYFPIILPHRQPGHCLRCINVPIYKEKGSSSQHEINNKSSSNSSRNLQYTCPQGFRPGLLSGFRTLRLGTS